MKLTGYVTPYAGVWIEIIIIFSVSGRPPVTPYAGVWIEIEVVAYKKAPVDGHSLRGSVD